MDELWDEPDEERSPICTSCGVSALPPEDPGGASICENADCTAFGEPIS